MSFIRHVTAYVLAAFLAAQPAAAQWQVPDHAVPLGNGGGVTGFNNAAPPAAAGMPLAGNGLTADPSFRAIVNAGIGPGAANTAKGSLDGLSTVDLTLPSCAADGRHAITYTSGVGWVCTATANSFTAVIPKAVTVTMAVGSPGVVTWTAHALADNAVVYFCTTGSLLTGLTTCNKAVGGSYPTDTLLDNPTLYYVVPGSQMADTFQVSATVGGAAVNFSGVQSGTHTGYANAFAAAGTPGEYRFHVTEITNAAVTSGVDNVYGTVPLTAGIWEVGGSSGTFGKSGTPVYDTNHSSLGTGITGICTTPFCGTMDLHITGNNPNGWLFPFDTQVIAVYSNSNLNAVCQLVWTGVGTATCFGNTWARRIR